MKKKIRELTDRKRGISNAVREKNYQDYVRGWVNYFRLADMKGLLRTTDEWVRRRMRALYWKQWKKTKTKYRKLKELGIAHIFCGNSCFFHFFFTVSYAAPLFSAVYF